MMYDLMETEKGPLIIAADDEGIHRIDFQDGKRRFTIPTDWQRGENLLIERAKTQLRAYFAGQLITFDLPLKPEGTDFQRKVWTHLCAIPLGTTTSYGELAAGLGKPSASRAVGAANGMNPISIVVPCHRVIRATGVVSGYRWGPPRKRAMLAWEAAGGEQAL